MPESKTTDFAKLLEQAVTQPGSIMKAYSAFHNYSLGNQLLAMFECANRGIEVGPINTYNRWQELGRQVRKGEKAITLCMPVTCKRETTVKEKADGRGDEVGFTRFIYRPRWFVLSQTDGQPMETPAIPDWNLDAALKATEIERVPFEDTDGNCQGYAKRGKREIAINPVAQLPFKTTIHEMAHVLLGHTNVEGSDDIHQTPKNIREVEAEAVALLVLEALNLPGAEFCRGYCQKWLGEGGEIPEASATKIMKVADKILKAGEVEREEERIAA
jgi:hypothetical protein